MKQIDQMIADCKINRDRVLANQDIPGPVRRELADNLWPCLEAFARTMGEEFAAVNAELEVLIGEEGSAIDPELGAGILGLFEIGRQLAAELESRIKASGDDVAKKRMLPTIRDFVRATHAIGEAVQAAMMEPDEQEDDAEDDAEVASDVEDGQE